MQGLIQSSPLTVDRILRHAAATRGHGEVVTGTPEGPPRRSSWAQVEEHARRLAGALAESGIGRGDAVAVIGANSIRQLEAWFAIMATGAACHPLSPALPPERIASLLRAHSDKAALIDPELLIALEPSLLRLPQLQRIIAMTEAGQGLQTRMNTVASQDAFMETAGRSLIGSVAEDGAAALLVHGVSGAGATAWSHRACVLQGLAAQGPQGLDFSPDEAVLALAPFWRMAAAGVLFAAPMAGAKLVLPGPRTDAQSVRILADRESVTVVVASPPQLQALHDQFRSESRRPNGLKRVIAAGAPCTAALVRAWRDSFGVEVWCAWGAAEVAGVAAVGRGLGGLAPLFGIDLDLTDADGRLRPHDGVAIGRLTAKGPLVASAGGASDVVDTGDLATIDPQGRVSLLGRADEQVSAGDVQIPAWPIEAAALENPATARAVAIDPPRGLAAEGPVLVVERKPGALAGKPEYLRFLGERLGGLALGDLLFVNGFPLDLAGRIDKSVLRERLEGLMAPPSEPVVAAPPPEADPPRTETEAEPPPAPLPAPPEAVPVLAAAAVAAPALFLEEPSEPTPEPPAEPEPPVDLAPEPLAPEPASPTEAEEPEASPLAEPVEVVPVEPEPARFSARADEPLSLSPATAPAAEAAAEDHESGLFLRLDSRPHRERRQARRRAGRVEVFLNVLAVLAMIPALMILVGALGVRFDLIDWRLGVGQLILDWPSKLALIGVLGGIFAVFVAANAGFGRYGLKAAISLVLPLATLVAVTWLKSLGESFPPVHEVATDWSQPVSFSPALIRARGSDAYAVEADPIVPAAAGAYMNRRVAEVNAETCPAAKPVLLSLPPAQAYARAKAAVLAQGLALDADQPASGRLEATASGLWLGLKDDLAVRVSATAGGSRVDLRSTSRAGLSDFGANCRRVANLVGQIAAGQAGGA